MATISPDSSWSGTLGSGYSDGGGSGVAEPSDPARSSFKPILALDTVPDQRVSGTLEITAVAFCKGGIDSVDFYLEGTKVSVTTQSLNSTTGVYGYTITIDVSGESNDGPMKLYVEAVPTSGSAQNRVIGAYTFYCNKGGTLANTGTTYYIDMTSDITVDGSVSGTFTFGEQMTQTTSGATARFISDDTTTVRVAYVQGTPNSSNIWTGDDSGATFTPSDTPTARGTSGGPGAIDTPFDTSSNATGYWRTNFGGGSSTANASGITLKYLGGVSWFATATLNTDNGHMIFEPADDGFTDHLAIRSNASARIIVEKAIVRNWNWTAIVGTDDIVLGNLTGSPLDLWMDSCNWAYGGGKNMPDTTSIQSVRFTNCETTGFGFLFSETVQLIRGCTCNSPDEDDVFSRAKWVLNNTVNAIADPVGGNHADIWQLEGITASVENYLMYNTVVTDSDSVQPLQWAENMTDCAVVNFLMQRTGTTATVFGNLQGNWDHVLMWNCSWNNYMPSFRADITWDYTSSANSEIRQCAFAGIDTQSVTEANVLTAVDVVDCNLADGSFSGGTRVTAVAEATVFTAPTTAGVAGMRPTASMPTATPVTAADAQGTAISGTSPIGALAWSAPTVSDVSPTSIAKGATADITLTGTGFIDGISAASNYAGAFTVNTTTFNSSTEVVVNVTGGSGTAGSYLDAITLTNPDGQTVDAALTLTTATGGNGGAGVSSYISAPGKQKYRRIWWEE